MTSHNCPVDSSLHNTQAAQAALLRLARALLLEGSEQLHRAMRSVSARGRMSQGM